MKYLNKATIRLGEDIGYDSQFYLNSLTQCLPHIYKSVRIDSNSENKIDNISIVVRNPIFYFDQKLQFNFYRLNGEHYVDYTFEMINFLWLPIVLFPLLAFMSDHHFGGLLIQFIAINTFLFGVYIFFTNMHVQAKMQKWQTEYLIQEISDKQNAHSCRYESMDFKYIFKSNIKA